MPIIKSAKKALRQNVARRKKNKACKQKIKSLVKDARTAIGGKNASEAQKNLPAIYKALDKAAKTGVIKKNTAARKKSRITKLIKKLS
jgi:small subunit ribosomal protein S20